jgi:hypothetical protein
VFHPLQSATEEGRFRSAGLATPKLEW